MNKNLVAKIALISSLALISAFGTESSFFGVEGGYFKSDMEDGFKAKAPNIGFKLGYDYGTHRTYVQYNYNLKAKKKIKDAQDTIQAEWKTHELVLGADATPQISENLKFAAGLYAGLSNFKYKGKWQEEAATIAAKGTETGLLVGARAGLIFDMSSSQIEIGLKADHSWYEDSLKQKKYGGYAGYNYKF